MLLAVSIDRNLLKSSSNAKFPLKPNLCRKLFSNFIEMKKEFFSPSSFQSIVCQLIVNFCFFFGIISFHYDQNRMIDADIAD